MKLRDQLLTLEITEEVIYETLQMINDIEQYLKGNQYFIMMQKEIGFKELFYRFIAKDWFRSDPECKKFRLQNKKIVKECVDYCGKYWKLRNEIHYNKSK